MNCKVITRTVSLGILFLPGITVSQEIAAILSPSYDQLEYRAGDFSLENQIDDLSLYEKQKPLPPWFVRRFKVTAGLFIPVNGTKIKVGSNDESFGTEIDLEDNLGFRKTTTTFLGNFQWRASRRSRFDLGYFHLDRSTTYQLQKEIEFGDHIYPVNATVNSSFKSDMYLFSYGYAFFLKPKYELGLMIGTHTLGTDIEINLVGETSQASYNDKFNFTAPLPDIGIWGGYSFADKFVVNGNLNYFYIEINDFKGKIVSYNLAVMYQALPELDIALGYSGMNFTVDVVKNRLDGYLKWGYNGPLFTVSYTFGKSFK